MTVTEELKQQHCELWRGATEHRFISELGDGSLHIDRFSRYFLQDYVFVNDLVKTSGIAVSKAPDLALARPIENFLNAILGAEDALFQDAFKTLKIPNTVYRKAEPLPTTAALGNFLVRLAYEGSFRQICCAMYVTEAVYMDWGERLLRTGADPVASGNEFGRFYQGWIDLHTEATLGNIVQFLGGVVNDAEPSELPGLRSVFERTLRYEIAFWEMAYSGEQWP